jgi:hypothetical protein
MRKHICVNYSGDRGTGAPVSSGCGTRWADAAAAGDLRIGDERRGDAQRGGLGATEKRGRWVETVETLRLEKTLGFFLGLPFSDLPRIG